MNPLYIIYAVCGLGILDTLYLIYHKIAGTDVSCLFFPKEWCLKVQYSPQSKTFGVPNSILGFLMYVGILVLAILSGMGIIPWWYTHALIAIGFLFSLYFTYVQAFILQAFCTWCVVSAVNFLILFTTGFFIR